MATRQVSQATADAVAVEVLVLEQYHKFLEEDEDLTFPIAAINALVNLSSHIKGSTVSEFTDKIQQGATALCSKVENSIAVAAGCDLFMRYLSRTLNHYNTHEKCKEHLLNNGQLFLERAKAARGIAGENGAKFITPNMTILTHGYSRSVLATFLYAAKHNKRFRVFLTESRPSGSGTLMFKRLIKEGISCCLILDSAAGSVMEQVDLVMVGAEGIVENGGIINQIGTFSIGIVAKACKKPMIVVAESHKFVRLMPLNQQDIPTMNPIYQFISSSSKESVQDAPDLQKRSNLNTVSNNLLMTPQQMNNCALQDFTPPEYIHALVTDLGIVDPMSGVSEELLRLHF